MIMLSPPPVSRGDAAEQLRQLYSYLYRLQEQINALVQSLESRLDKLENT